MELQDIPRFMNDPGRMQCVREQHGLYIDKPPFARAYLAEIMVKRAVETKITDLNRLEIGKRCRVSPWWLKCYLPNKILVLSQKEIIRAHHLFNFEGLVPMVRYIRSRSWKGRK